MSQSHTATVAWDRPPGAVFTDNRYPRRHLLRFDGGCEVPASSSPLNVPRWSDPAAVDPEELFVAALASCHMLWFLSLAAAAGHRVDSYRDDAVGTMAPGADGRVAMTVVTLHPQVAFGGEHLPDRAALLALHHAAHDRCYIASSVNTDVRCQPA